MKIYDIGGRLVRTVSVGFKPVGYYLTRQNGQSIGMDEMIAGEAVSSGDLFFTVLSRRLYVATQRGRDSKIEVSSQH